MERRILVLAGPSAVGKTSIAEDILSKSGEYVFIRSATTRKPRNDAYRDEYVYMSKEEFLKISQSGGFLEFMEYSSEFYGTPRGEIDSAFEKGKIPLKSEWLTSGDLAVVYSDSAVIYSPSGVKRATIDLTGHSSHAFELDSSLMVSVYNTTVLGYDKTVNIYDKNADLIMTVSLEGELIKILPQKEKVCLLFEDRAVLIDTVSKEVKEAPVKPNAKDIAFYGNTVIVCCSGGAEPLRFDK